MKTVSITVQNLCIPCENRCRYCLLSYDGYLRGTDYDRSEQYARRFFYGYSMDHPMRSF